MIYHKRVKFPGYKANVALFCLAVSNFQNKTSILRVRLH